MTTATRKAAPAGLSESLQDYLEVVYVLVRRDRVARMKDIAAALGVGKSSVTGAVQALAERGLVHYGPYQFVTLTERGGAVGRALVRRHGLIKEFLMEVLAVPEQEAETVGCKMEHAIKGEVLDRFVRFLAFARRRSRTDRGWAAAVRGAGRRRATARLDTMAEGQA
jgi:DtxR family Mn-dependent transcriptional regulator